MSLQVQRTQQQQQQSEITELQSVAVMKNCIRLGISTIAFRRSLFPNEVFTSKSYAGVTLEVIRPIDRDGKVVNAGALQVLEWIELGCFQCLESGYLDQLVFNILDAHPDDDCVNVLESYTFTVGSSVSKPLTQQQGGGKSNKVQIHLPKITKDEVHHATQRLIKTLMTVTAALPPLPPTRWLSISLAYNASAPPGYQAPNFASVDPKMEPCFASSSSLFTDLGEVNTGHQRIVVQLRQVDPAKLTEQAGSTQRFEDRNENEEDEEGYESDNTDLRWAQEKLRLIQQAEQIIQNAKRAGIHPEVALQNSGLIFPPSVLHELIFPTTSKPPQQPAIRSYSRVNKGKHA